MASGSNPSSKRKSSSSHKKKISKKSSEVRKRKSRSRKREKSNKLRRHRDVSVSDDNSRTENSTLISSSDSDFDYKRREGRSRTRGDVKGRKKKLKRRSSPIGEDSGDSPARKKRKGSKKIDSVEPKKRARHEKPRKRDVSVDSRSGDLRSFSSSDDNEFEGSMRGRSKGREKGKKSLDKIIDESEFEGSKRGRSKGREKGKKSLDKIIDGEDRYRYRSGSCSSSSEGSERGHYYVEERLPSENTSRRLRSVLAVPNDYEGGRYQIRDENKPEIIQAYDDCPSCKSNDSYDGGRKKESSYQAYDVPEKKRQVYEETFEDERRKESSHQLNVAPEKKPRMHNEKVDDAVTSNFKTTQSTHKKEEAVAQYGKIDRTATVESAKTAKRSEVSSDILNSEVADLESILRQKALENFIKFRGGRQANTGVHDQKGGSDSGVRKPCSSKDGPIKTESSKEVSSRAVVAKDIETPNMKNVGTTAVEEVSVATSPKHRVTISDGNLRKFHGGHQANITHDDQKGETDIAVKKSSTLKDDPIKIESSRKVGSKVMRGNDVEASEMRNVSTRTVERISVSNSPKRVQTPDVNSKRLESSDSMHSAHGSLVGGKFPSDGRPVDFKPMEKKIINLGAIRKSGQGSLVYRRDSSHDNSIKQASQSQDHSDEKSQETKTNGNKIVPEPPKAAAGTSSDPQEISKASGSAVPEATSPPTPATGEHGSTESGNVARGGSEFEQKTMSVMRGGEMVQVSYKVYIPKKSPALARRQLNR